MTSKLPEKNSAMVDNTLLTKRRLKTTCAGIRTQGVPNACRVRRTRIIGSARGVSPCFDSNRG
jgi:hypothetical protein